MTSSPNRKAGQRKLDRRSFVSSFLYTLATVQSDLLFKALRVQAQAVGRPISIIDLKGEHPGVPTMMPDLRTIVSVNQESSNLSLVDSYTYQLIGTIPLSAGHEPWEIAFTPDGKLGFVSHSGFDSDQNSNSVVTIVNMINRKEVKQIGVGKRPNGVSVDRSGKYALVANMGSNTVSVISTDTLEKIKDIQVGRSPFDIGITPDNVAIVVNFLDASISFIELTNFTVFDTLTVGTSDLSEPYPEFGAGDSVQIAVNSWNGDAYITNYRTHGMVVVDTTARAIKARIPTVSYPFGVAVWEATNLVCVLSGESRNLAVIDLGTNQNMVEKFAGLDQSIRDRELALSEARANTQIEVIPLGRGGGKPPLRLPTTRARDLNICYVDPIKGLMYIIPPDPDSETRKVLFAASPASNSNAGA